MPPGISYYEQMTVQSVSGEPATIWVPKTRLLAACEHDLEAEDILALIEQLNGMARKRGLL